MKISSLKNGDTFLTQNGSFLRYASDNPERFYFLGRSMFITLEEYDKSLCHYFDKNMSIVKKIEHKLIERRDFPFLVTNIENGTCWMAYSYSQFEIIADKEVKSTKYQSYEFVENQGGEMYPYEAVEYYVHQGGRAIRIAGDDIVLENDGVKMVISRQYLLENFTKS